MYALDYTYIYIYVYVCVYIPAGTLKMNARMFIMICVFICSEKCKLNIAHYTEGSMQDVVKYDHTIFKY